MAHERKMINSLIRAAQYCPVTGNLPTEMTAESFEEACALARQKERQVGFCRNRRKALESWCDTCQGLHAPKGLTIITKKRALSRHLATQRQRRM
jgi:hypothetical protein